MDTIVTDDHYSLPPIPPPIHDEPRRLPRLLLVIVAMILLGSAFAWWQFGGTTSTDSRTVSGVEAADPDARAPDSVRVRVRVVNATPTSGLARRAMWRLRDLGYDVVDFGNERPYRDTTAILVHTGHTDWGTRASRALGGGDVIDRPDSLRYVDLTVVLGRDWKAPPQPLRP